MVRRFLGGPMIWAPQLPPLVSTLSGPNQRETGLINGEACGRVVQTEVVGEPRPPCIPNQYLRGRVT